MTWVVAYFLPGAVIAIMFAVGLDLRLRDFTRLVQFPKAAAVGLVGQLVLLPAIGFALAFTVRFDVSLAIGIVLLAACPGGATSNMVAYLARANTALSVSLTTITSVVSFLFIPLLVNLGLAWFGATQADLHLPMLATVQRIFLFTIVPILAGMAVRKALPGVIKAMQPYIQRLSLLLLLTILAVVFVTNWDKLIADFWRLAPAAVALTTLAGLAGYGAARAAGLDRTDRFTISIEVGFQNIALAQLIAATILERPELGLLAAVYPFANWVPLIPWLMIFKRGNRPTPPGETSPTDRKKGAD